MHTYTALYDADRQAHEEAVSNGGVSRHLHFLFQCTEGDYSRDSLSCTGTEFLTQKRE